MRTRPRRVTAAQTLRCIMLAMNSSLRSERQRDVVAALMGLLPREAILSRLEDTAPFECDALTAYRVAPMVVVLPDTEAQVSAILKLCHGLGVPIVVCPGAPRLMAPALFCRSPSSTRS
jgi:hypothetical protein